jgi:hypothetical protein
VLSYSGYWGLETRKELRVKKTIVMLGLCLVLLVATFGCAGGNSHKMDMQMGVSALVALADSHIESYVNSLEALAITQEVQSGNWEEMRSLLNSTEQGQVSSIVWFVLPDGSYYTVEEGKTSKNLSDRAYFPSLKDGNEVLGYLIVSKATGQKSLAAAVPVMKDGVVIGGLGASIFLEDLSNTLSEELALSDDMVFYAINEEVKYAVNETGEVVLHSNTELIFTENPALPKDAVTKTSPLTGWHFVLGFKD